jgi:hypothetical protein
MNIIKHKSAEKSWDIDLGALARIWKARQFANGALLLMFPYTCPLALTCAYPATKCWARVCAILCSSPVCHPWTLVCAHQRCAPSSAAPMCIMELPCLAVRIPPADQRLQCRRTQGGCIIRAKFLDDIKQAYQRDAALENLLMDPFFAENLAQRQESWRRVVSQVCRESRAVPICAPCPPNGAAGPCAWPTTQLGARLSMDCDLRAPAHQERLKCQIARVSLSFPYLEGKVCLTNPSFQDLERNQGLLRRWLTKATHHGRRPLRRASRRPA